MRTDFFFTSSCWWINCYKYYKNYFFSVASNTKPNWLSNRPKEKWDGWLMAIRWNFDVNGSFHMKKMKQIIAQLLIGSCLRYLRSCNNVPLLIVFTVRHRFHSLSRSTAMKSIPWYWRFLWIRIFSWTNSVMFDADCCSIQLIISEPLSHQHHLKIL